MRQAQHASRGFSYFVAAGLGLSFSLTLIFLAWQNALEGEIKRFAFESGSLKDTIVRSITASDDVAHSVAILFEAMDNMAKEPFQLFASSVLARHSFIESISYYSLVRDSSTYQFLKQFQIVHKSVEQLAADFDLFSDPRVHEVVRIAIENGVTVPTPPVAGTAENPRYTLLKAVFAKDLANIPHQPLNRVKGLVTVSINPRYLFGQSSLHENLSLVLQSESEGIMGRQVLFKKQPKPANNSRGWVIISPNEAIVIRFPYYSMKLTVGKDIYWDDIDRRLIFTALILASGVSLLLIALARAKEAQARELRERNAEIERQVQSQTKELAQARDQALEASRVKSEFLASMSHEIRTPLNAIIGMAELLTETQLTQDQKQYVEVFKKAGEALLSLVNDILDLSKIEARQLVLEQIDFNLRELIEEACEIYALKADEKGIELVHEIAPEVPLFVTGDPSRLRQIILNLIGNAIKFTNHGEIAVRVMPDPHDPTLGCLLFSVSDTGIGIPPGKLESIFTSFTQVDSSTTRKYGGTGLGLTISKRLVELMGGRLWVESEIGKGSTFFFSIKLGIAPQQEEKPVTLQVQLQGRRILIIDNNATNRLILHRTLTAHGAQVIEATDGPSGLAEFRKAQQQGTGFELVLVDSRMPGMDGFEVTQAIKAAGGNVRTVLMLTSSDLSDHLTRAHNLNVGAYLVKPVKWKDLVRAINLVLLPTPVEDAEKMQACVAQTLKAAKVPILLVEDTADNRLLIKAYLKNTPYEVDEAENGEIAISKFMTRPYRLVLMDVQMPVMDGHAATRAIRAWEREQGRRPTPIIALTAHAIKEDREHSIAAGCTAHLTKPIKKVKLLQMIEQYVN